MKIAVVILSGSRHGLGDEYYKLILGFDYPEYREPILEPLNIKSDYSHPEFVTPPPMKVWTIIGRRYVAGYWWSLYKRDT